MRTADNIGAVPPSGVNVDITGSAGEALAAGDLAYLSDGSGSLNQGQWYKADADLFYGSIHPTLGFVPTTIASGSTGSFRISGAITQAGLSVGSTYYVSGTAAAITTTAPANARAVGQAISATSLVINIGNPWILDAGQDLRTMDGRLTLTTSTPVTVSDTTASTIFYTPYTGNRVVLFDGLRWKAYSFSELSLAVTCTANKPYDVWLYDNAGTLTLETLVWTNDSTRATAIVRTNGVWTKTGATTRRYVGSFYCDSGANAITDSAANRKLFNADNRVTRHVRATETTDSWTYTTNTWRQANGATGNQVNVMVGLAEEAFELSLTALSANSNANIIRYASIGVDSLVGPVSGPAGYVGQVRMNALTTANILYTTITRYAATPSTAGFHFYAWLENSIATGTTTWYGDNGASDEQQAGLVGTVRN